MTTARVLLLAALLALAPGAGAQQASEPPLARPGTENEREADIEAEAQPEPEEPASVRPLARPGDLPGLPDTSLGAGWTLRAVPDGSLLALAGGPGLVASLSAFCLGGQPWLALELDPAPDAPSIRADFGFTAERVEAEALREEGAGGAFVVELAGSPLPGLLAGADAAASLAVDGTQQGPLSLAGSSRAIRAALEPCHTF